jgi:hypothetical protein
MGPKSSKLSAGPLLMAGCGIWRDSTKDLCFTFYFWLSNLSFQHFGCAVGAPR